MSRAKGDLKLTNQIQRTESQPSQCRKARQIYLSDSKDHSLIKMGDSFHSSCPEPEWEGTREVEHGMGVDEPNDGRKSETDRIEVEIVFEAGTSLPDHHKSCTNADRQLCDKIRQDHDGNENLSDDDGVNAQPYHEEHLVDKTCGVDSWWCKIFLLVLTVLSSVIIIIVTIVFVVSINSQPSFSINPVPNHISPICTPCMKLTKDLYNPYGPDPLMDKLTRERDKGVPVCCANNMDQVTAMLEMRLRPQKSIPIAEAGGQHFRFTPVSAHKSLLPPLWEKGTPRLPDSHIHLKLNQHHDYMTEHAHGVNMTDVAMVIQNSGLYYVYSSVLFRPIVNETVGNLESKVLRARVELHRPTGTEGKKSLDILLMMTHTTCTDCSRNVKTAQAGGLFHLKEGGEIRVCLEQHCTVDYTQESTFLGMYMVDSDQNTETD